MATYSKPLSSEYFSSTDQQDFGTTIRWEAVHKKREKTKRRWMTPGWPENHSPISTNNQVSSRCSWDILYPVEKKDYDGIRFESNFPTTTIIQSPISIRQLDPKLWAICLKNKKTFQRAVAHNLIIFKLQCPCGLLKNRTKWIHRNFAMSSKWHLPFNLFSFTQKLGAFRNAQRNLAKTVCTFLIKCFIFQLNFIVVKLVVVPL